MAVNTAPLPRIGPLRGAPLTALVPAVAALGVVFGDIGTSPLYALQTVFAIDGGAVRPTRLDLLGVGSLVFWAITLIVSIKYVALIMRADNDGEGGVLALAALVQRARRSVAALVALGVFGAALFYGDSVITPAISVLSAVEGLDVAAPSLSHLIVPITLAVLAALFVIQRRGTRAVGRLFGPVMVLWFAVIAVAGLREVLEYPRVLEGLLPTYGLRFLANHPATGFVALGAVMLAITGAEALYADMGHFGLRPIRRAWFGVVFPALTLNYLGQTALILHSPSAVANPFFLLVPGWARMPMVLLATAATIIASQAVISGAFSVARQAVHLGFLPRLSVRHTSERDSGQIYVPAVNWWLFGAVVAVVAGFGSAQRLGAAYGVAVSGTFVITTMLFLVYARSRWPAWRIVAAGLAFLPVEAAFLAANVSKVDHGGWLPLLIAAALFLIMTTWHRGGAILSARRARSGRSLRGFVAGLDAAALRRVPGTAVFLSSSKETTPLAMRVNVEHNHVLHEHVVIVSVRPVGMPRVAARERVAIERVRSGDVAVAQVTARFGFHEEPDVPDALRLAQASGLGCDLAPERTTYFVSRIDIDVTDAPGLRVWRKLLFAALARNAADPVDHFRLPAERTVLMGAPVPL